MQCAKCGHWYSDSFQIEAIEQWGKCVGCDHVELDVQEEEGINREEIYD